MNISICRAIEQPLYNIAYSYVPSVTYKVTAMVLPLFVTIFYMMAEVRYQVYNEREENLDWAWNPDNFMPDHHIVVADAINLLNPIVYETDKKRNVSEILLNAFHLLLGYDGDTCSVGDTFVVVCAYLFSFNHFIKAVNLEGFLRNSRRLCNHIDYTQYSLPSLKRDVLMYHADINPQLDRQERVYKVIDTAQCIFSFAVLLRACYLKYTEKQGPYNHSFSLCNYLMFSFTIGMVFFSVFNLFNDVVVGRPRIE